MLLDAYTSFPKACLDNLQEALSDSSRPLSLQELFCFWGRNFSWFKSSSEHPQTLPASRLSSAILMFLIIPPTPGHLLLLVSWPEHLSSAWTLHMAMPLSVFKS